MSLQIRRGNEAERTNYTFAEGELAFTKDTQKLYIGDGNTPGGLHVLATSVGPGFTFNSTTQEIEFSVPSLNLTADDVAETVSKKWFTDTRAVDAVGTALQAGPNSGITFTFNPVTHVISADVTESAAAILPSDAGKAGHYLSTDGFGNFDWVTAPLSGLGLPSELAGRQGQYLTSDGDELVWGTFTPFDSIVNGAYTVGLTNAGDVLVSITGDIKLASGVDIKRDIGGGVYQTVLGGLETVSGDTSPTLGGNLSLGGNNITGTGNINITGNITASGTLNVSGLANDLTLGGNDIIGTGNILITGGITSTGITNFNNATSSTSSSTGALIVSGGVGVGGNVNVAGTISSILGLGNSLNLNNNNITGSGAINISGAITGTTGNFNSIQLGVQGSISGGPIFVNTSETTFVKVTGNNTARWVSFVNGGTNAEASAIALVKTRGSVVAPTTVVNGDRIGTVTFSAFDGTDFRASGSMIGYVDGAVSTGVVPVGIQFNTTNGTGGSITSMDVKATRVNFNVAPVVPVYSTTGDRDTAIPSPAAGMICFAGGNFYGHNGTIWKQLDN